MSKAFNLQRLVEDIQERHMAQENDRLVRKWTDTCLLKGLSGHRKEVMARLLENQAAEFVRQNRNLLTEASSVSTGAGALAQSGDLRGFQNIAFPLVRRVFGGLIANELISVQPMSLPSGLLFYLDYTYGSNQGAAAGQATYASGDSIYNSPEGVGVRSGSLATGGQFDLVGHGFSKVHASTTGRVNILASGAFNTSGLEGTTLVRGATMTATGSDGVILQFDPQLTRQIEQGIHKGDRSLTDPGKFQVVIMRTTDLSGSNSETADLTNIDQVALSSNNVGSTGLANVAEKVQGGNVVNVRRLNQRGDYSVAAGGSGGVWTSDPFNGSHILMVVSGALIMQHSSADGDKLLSTLGLTASFVVADTLNVDSTVGDTLTIPSFETDFGATPSPAIPEIDIKVQSVAVTATSRKLRARWSPELAQDLNAYHNLDAEVELTQILSEQIALEIDREILNDLVEEGNGARFHWSRSPGRFINKETGKEVSRTNSLTPGPAFTGTVRDWYETLIETIIDVANQIHRKTLRGSANFIVTSPDVCTILEASVLYKPEIKIGGDGQASYPAEVGAQSAGSLAGRFKLYKDPYFPRNKVLVGYKGGSFLESGYVYAPYVPLIVTPVIFEPNDFSPRRGVMTRYGKKMVRSDFYGVVFVHDMDII